MGYYSDVRVVVSKDGYKELKNFVSKESGNKHCMNILESLKIFEEKDDEVYLGWDSIKWYKEFGEIDIFLKGLNHLEKSGFSYAWLRQGEMIDDVEGDTICGKNEDYLYWPYLRFADDDFKESTHTHNKENSCNASHEEKQKIADSLCKTLQLTRGQYDLVSIKIEETPYGDEIAVATYQNGGTKKVYVTADSGMAMVADIVKGVF